MYRVSTPSGTISWNDGSAFDGFVEIGIAPPLARTNVTLRQGVHPRLPLFWRFRIASGAFYPEGCGGLIYTEDIAPPNTHYKAHFYDSSGVSVGTSATFTVTASTFSIPAVTLTAPSAGTDPTPS